MEAQVPTHTLKHIEHCVLVSERGVRLPTILGVNTADKEDIASVYYLTLRTLIRFMTGGTSSVLTGLRFNLVDVVLTCANDVVFYDQQFQVVPKHLWPQTTADLTRTLDALYVCHKDLEALLYQALCALSAQHAKIDVLRTFSTQQEKDNGGTEMTMAYLHSLERRVVHYNTSQSCALPNAIGSACHAYTRKSFDAVCPLIAIGMLHQTRTASYNNIPSREPPDCTVLAIMFEARLVYKHERFETIRSRSLQFCLFLAHHQQHVQSVEAEKALLKDLANEERLEAQLASRRDKKRLRKQQQRHRRRRQEREEDQSEDPEDNNNNNNKISIMQRWQAQQPCHDAMKEASLIIELDDEDEQQPTPLVSSLLSPNASCFVPSKAYFDNLGLHQQTTSFCFF